MPIRLSTTLVLPAALAAAVVAYLVSDRIPSGDSSPVAPAVAAAPAEANAGGVPPMGALPPNHPPIGATSPHGGAPQDPSATPAFVENQEPQAITWKAPASWKAAPNASAMRLATYRVGDAAELAVMRAGGTVDANVQRWQGQFQDGAKVERKDKAVHGIKVTVVHIEGTFAGGGMPGSPAGAQAGWAMLAAIVETPGSPYFFKLVGPADQVKAAKAGFDGMIDGITPNAAK